MRTKPVVMSRDRFKELRKIKELINKLEWTLDSGETINPVNPDMEIIEGEEPFRTVIINNFLKPEVHEEIKEEFFDIPIDTGENKGATFTDDPLFVEYRGDWHDAWRMNLNPEYDLKMNFFQTKAWQDFIASFYSDTSKPYYREFTNEVLTELHHHEELSRDGFIHNDYDPAVFLGNRVYEGLDTSWRGCRQEACDYPDDNTRYVARTAANIYYVGYGPKVNEDEPAGGHTALFVPGPDFETPVAGVEPIENRLAMFENSPISFHASRTNNSTYRDTIYNWWHTEIDFAQKMYPDTDLCQDVRVDYRGREDQNVSENAVFGNITPPGSVV